MSNAIHNIPVNTLCYFQWPQFYRPLSHVVGFDAEVVGKNPVGARWGLWPLYFEEYYSDEEPNLKEDSDPDHRAPNRLVIWHRLARTDVPTGWVHAPLPTPKLVYGYHALSPNYFLKWNKRVQTYRNRWLRCQKDVVYKIVTLSYQEFLAAYVYSTVAKEMPTLNRLKERIAISGKDIHLWGVRRMRDDAVVAGLAVIDSPENRGSYYSNGFYLPETANDNLMVALFDHWFASSLANNISVLHFGSSTFSKTWGAKRGYNISVFKAKFSTDYFRYQTPLYTFRRGRIFPH